MKEDMCQKPKNSLKSAFKLALNDLKTCPSRQNQKLQGKKWAYFPNWTLGLRVTASTTHAITKAVGVWLRDFLLKTCAKKAQRFAKEAK